MWTLWGWLGFRGAAELLTREQELDLHVKSAILIPDSLLTISIMSTVPAGVPESVGVSEEKDSPQYVKDAAEALNKEGFVDDGDGVAAVRVVSEADSTGKKVQDLMAQGVSEEEAKSRAVAEVGRGIENGEKDYPDMAAYVRDQKRVLEDYKIDVDSSVSPEMKELIAQFFRAPGDYFVPRKYRGDNEEVYHGILYLGGDRSIRYMNFPSDCNIGGRRLLTESEFWAELKKIGFRPPPTIVGWREGNKWNEVNNWLCDRLEKIVDRKKRAKEAAHTREFEF